jgi:T5SS/PEP-CTERM-associated repeat protein/autotransporter-associated beta strand protein
MKFKATLFALLAASALPSHATTYTWTGDSAETNNWSDSGNWNGNGRPTSSNNTILEFTGNPDNPDANVDAWNDFPDWSMNIGQLNFSDDTITLDGNNFGFEPLNGSQQINQNSEQMQFIINPIFAFRSGSDSQINLNAGDLVIESAVYLDRNSGTARQLMIGGTTNDPHALTIEGSINKGGNGYDPDMVIQNNKRVTVLGALTFGSGTDGSVFIKSGLLEFQGTGSMTGAPVIGNSSGADDAKLLLSGGGLSMSNQLEFLGGSTGRRVIGGTANQGNVTFSGAIIGSNSPASYDVVAARGGSVTLSGTRNLNSVLNINRPEEGEFYGGTVVLSGTSTSTSGVNVYGGILSVSAENRLGSSGTLTLDGGTFQQSAAFSTARNIVLGGNGGKLDNSTVYLSATPTFSGAISGTGNLVVATTDAYTLPGSPDGFQLVEGVRLTGNNTYVGSTTITSGYVNGSSATAFGHADNTVVLNGGGLNFDSSLTHNYKISLVNRGNLNVKSGFTVNAATAISGTGGLDKRGAGTLVLSTENTYTGTTVIYDGNLSLAHPRALANSTVNRSTATGNLLFAVEGENTYHLGGLSGNQIMQIGGNSLSLGGSNQDWTSNIGVVGTGSLIKSGTGKMTIQGSGYFDIPTLQVDGGEFHLNGVGSFRPSINVSVASGAILNNPRAIGSLSGLGTVKGTVTISSAGNSTFAGNFMDATVMINSAENLAFGGNFSAVSLTKSGAGTLRLSGAGSGNVVVTAGALEWAAGASYDVTNGSGFVIGFNDGNDGTALIRSGAAVTSFRTWIGYNTGSKGSIVVEGTLSSSAEIRVGGSGQGSLTIKDGGRAVVGTELQLSPFGLASSGWVRVEAGGTLQIGTGGNGGGMWGDGILTNNGTIVFNRASNYTLATQLQGIGNLVKQGGGTLTLPSGVATTYSGATTVSAGTLALSGSGSIASSSNYLINGTLDVSATPSGVFTVAAGKTLSGSGTVAGGVTVSGTISPGENGIGTLSTGSVLLTGTWACEINGAACDVLAVTGDFITGATARLVVTGTPTVDRYVIATYTGSLGATASSESPVLPSGYEFAVDFVNQQVLLVKSAGAPSPYATWSVGKNLVVGVNDGATQDPDGDGNSNVLEFVLGGNPLASDRSISPVETLTADNLVFTFNRSDASKQEVSLAFQSGTDLASWTEVAIGASSAGSVVVVENADAPDTITVTLPRANAVGGKLFGRLKATLKTAP